MIVVGQSEQFEATYSAGVAGLVPGVEVAILDNDGATVFGPTGSGIIELDVGGIPSGVYSVELISPADTGQFSIVWSPDGSWLPATNSPPDDLIVSLTASLPPIVPGPVGATASPGPCSLWATVDDVAACCDAAADLGTDLDPLETHLITASQILFELTGRRYAGSCGAIARPCSDGCGCWPTQTLAWPDGGTRQIWHGWTGADWGWTVNGSAYSCGCGCVPQILLSGYPIQEITAVTIDGETVDPGSYELREKRYLVRTDGSFWPSCQNIAAENGEPGSFVVTYVHGEGPPNGGAAAAAALACELFAACGGGGGGDCDLPDNVVRQVRQGITQERIPLIAASLVAGATGNIAIDSFLSVYGRKGRRPSFWSPDGPRYARRVGA